MLLLTVLLMVGEFGGILIAAPQLRSKIEQQSSIRRQN
jgi:uncharacterized protein YneF (UPF0154 family)